jgi:hypothetical protein
VFYCHSIASKYASERETTRPNLTSLVERKTDMITTTTTSATSVLNLRIPDEVKAAIASLAIADGRSMSQIALRAIKLGLEQLAAPAPTPAVKTPKVLKTKGKGKSGEPPAAPAAPAKPCKK